MSKDRDINVGSIEKDIENLEKYIELVIDKNYCDCNELNVICYGKYADGSKNVASSIKNILQDYTRQKQINEEHQKINGELMKAINTVEKEKGDWIKAYQEEKDKQFDILRNSIPIQVIKDYLKEEQERFEVYKKESETNENLKLGMYKHLGAKNMCEKILGIEKIVTLD